MGPEGYLGLFQKNALDQSALWPQFIPLTWKIGSLLPYDFPKSHPWMASGSVSMSRMSSSKSDPAVDEAP